MPIVLEFYNSAISPVPSVIADFDVFINNREVATAETSAGTLDPNERTRTRINVIIDYADVVGQLLNAIQYGSFTLILDGELRSEGVLPFLSVTRHIRVGGQVG